MLKVILLKIIFALYLAFSLPLEILAKQVDDMQNKSPKVEQRVI